MNLEIEQSSFIRELNSFLETPLSPFMERKVKTLLNQYSERIAKKPLEPEIRVKVKEVTKYVMLGVNRIMSPVITVKDILWIVSKYTGIGVVQIRSDRRYRHFVYARNLVYYFSRYFTRLSLTKIAMEISGADHTTVINGLANINNLKDTDEKVMNDLNNIANLIHEKFPIKEIPCMASVPELPFTEIGKSGNKWRLPLAVAR